MHHMCFPCWRTRPLENPQHTARAYASSCSRCSTSMRAASWYLGTLRMIFTATYSFFCLSQHSSTRPNVPGAQSGRAAQRAVRPPTGAASRCGCRRRSVVCTPRPLPPLPGTATPHALTRQLPVKRHWGGERELPAAAELPAARPGATPASCMQAPCARAPKTVCGGSAQPTHSVSPHTAASAKPAWAAPTALQNGGPHR